MRQIFGAVTRTGTLLQSRYTTPGFWRAGQQLFQAAQGAVNRVEDQRKLAQLVSKADTFLTEAGEAGETGGGSSEVAEGRGYEGRPGIN